MKKALKYVFSQRRKSHGQLAVEIEENVVARGYIIYKLGDLYRVAYSD